MWIGIHYVGSSAQEERNPKAPDMFHQKKHVWGFGFVHKTVSKKIACSMALVLRPKQEPWVTDQRHRPAHWHEDCEPVSDWQERCPWSRDSHDQAWSGWYRQKLQSGPWSKQTCGVSVEFSKHPDGLHR